MSNPLPKTPNCQFCGSYYSECECVDCSLFLCTWCNISIHEPIGKRNHERVHLYPQGKTFAYANIAARNQADSSRPNTTRTTSTSAATMINKITAEGHRGSKTSLSAGVSGNVENNRSFSLLTECQFSVSVAEGWSILGNWDYCFFSPPPSGPFRLPHLSTINSSDDSRSFTGLIQPRASRPSTGNEAGPTAAAQETIAVEVNEILIERDDQNHFYRYSGNMNISVIGNRESWSSGEESQKQAAEGETLNVRYVSKFGLVSSGAHSSSLVWLLSSSLPSHVDLSTVNRIRSRVGMFASAVKQQCKLALTGREEQDEEDDFRSNDGKTQE